MAAHQPGLMERFENYLPTKTVLAWCCALSVVATMVVGFVWGGWVTGGTAAEMARKAGDEANASLAAAICMTQFNKAGDATTQLAALHKLDTWQRSDFIKKGGWANLPGMKDPVNGSSEMCAKKLIEATAAPVTKAAS